jgi:tetratricopeptide (TPR) repeat protein
MRLGAVSRALAAALAVAAAQTPARADPTPTELQAARDLFAKAEKDEAAGRWADALDELKRAFSVKATPGLRFHIALCEEKLGRIVAALADYAAAEQAAREQDNKEVLDAVAEPLRNLRIRVPTLTIEVPAADGAKVTLDGNPVPAGLYGVAMPVQPGTHRIEARARGKHPFQTEVKLEEREAQTASVQWRDLPKLPESGGPTPGGDHENPPPEETAHHGSKAGAIVASISAAALLGFGIGSYVAADDAKTSFLAQCPTQLYCDDLRGPVRAWDALALTGFLAAAATTVLAVVLWAVPSGGDRTKSSARLELRLGGATLSGSF